MNPLDAIRDNATAVPHDDDENDSVAGVGKLIVLFGVMGVVMFGAYGGLWLFLKLLQRYGG